MKKEKNEHRIKKQTRTRHKMEPIPSMAFNWRNKTLDSSQTRKKMRTNLCKSGRKMVNR